MLSSLCKKTPNTALLSPQLPVIYKSKLLIIKTCATAKALGDTRSKALSLTFSCQRIKKNSVFVQANY